MPQTIIINILLLALTVWIIYGPWQRLVTKFVNLYIEDIKDKLILAGADKKMSLNSIEFNTIEDKLDQMVEYSYKVTWPRLLLTFIFMRLKPNEIRLKPEQDIYQMINKVRNVEVRSELTNVTDKAFRAMFYGVIIKSPVFLAIGLIIYAISYCYKKLKNSNLISSKTFIPLIEKDMQLSTC